MFLVCFHFWGWFGVCLGGVFGVGCSFAGSPWVSVSSLSERNKVYQIPHGHLFPGEV